MKLIIDIPEVVKHKVYAYGLSLCPSDKEQLIHAIMNGTPLPKGHGRIADMDAAIKCIEDVEGEDAIWAIALIDWACSKRTIIEADKAESEEV